MALFPRILALLKVTKQKQLSAVESQNGIAPQDKQLALVTSNGCALEQVETAKLPCLELDSEMTFTCHVDYSSTDSASCCFSTSCILTKSRPSTVGVPAWAKAAKKRNARVLLLDKKKTDEQMQAEVRLADINSNKSDFLTTTRVGIHRPKTKPHSLQTKSRMAATSNEEMFVFHHPAKDYPVEHTKGVNSNDWMSMGEPTMDGYKDQLSESEVTEIQLLRNKDPKLWTVDVLSHMYKVKPLLILIAAPFTVEQQLQLDVEQEFLSRLSDYEKKEYADFQNQERKKQLKKTVKKTQKTIRD